MIEQGQVYEVYDAFGRHWGKVCLERVYNSCISGSLEALPEFDDVQKLFLEIEHNSTVDACFDHADTSKAIAELGVSLLNTDTKETVQAGIVFVSEKLLFTCEFNEIES